MKPSTEEYYRAEFVVRVTRIWPVWLALGIKVGRTSFVDELERLSRDVAEGGSPGEYA